MAESQAGKVYPLHGKLLFFIIDGQRFEIFVNDLL